MVRELFGAGKLLGVEILPLVTDGGWYNPNGLLLLPPPSAFFLIGLFIWALRSFQTLTRSKQPDFKMAKHILHSRRAPNMEQFSEPVCSLYLYRQHGLGVLPGHVHLPRGLQERSHAAALGLGCCSDRCLDDHRARQLPHLHLPAWPTAHLAWAGLPDLDLSFLGLLSYIGVIAAQWFRFIEMFLDKYRARALYNALGAFSCR